jgi:hypothetical protein
MIAARVDVDHVAERDARRRKPHAWEILHAAVKRSELLRIAVWQLVTTATPIDKVATSTRIHTKGPGNGIRGVGPKEGGRLECLIHLILVARGLAANAWESAETGK